MRHFVQQGPDVRAQLHQNHTQHITMLQKSAKKGKKNNVQVWRNSTEWFFFHYGMDIKSLAIRQGFV